MSKFLILPVGIITLLVRSAHAQFNTPSIDGVIQPGEYGNPQNRTNQIGTNTGQTWYGT